MKTYAERYATKGNEQYDKEKTETYAKVAVYQNRSAKLAPEQFVGTYRDAWFGDAGNF